MARTNPLTLLSASLVLGGLWLAGCASKTAEEEPEVNTGLSHLAEESAAAVQNDAAPVEQPFDIASYTAQLEGMSLDGLAAQSRSPAPVTPQQSEGEGWLASLSTDPGTALWMNTQRTFATMREQVVEPAWRAMLSEQDRRSRTPEQQLAMHVEQIAAILRAQNTSETDIGRLIALSAMEAVRPGTLDESVDPLELELLRPEERSTLEAVRAVVASHAHPLSDEAQPADVSRQFLDAADRVWEATPLNIKFSTLARRVVGYGRYEPFANSSFVAGRPQRMIVYTEIDNFSHRPFRDADLPSSAESFGASWTVEVSQELRLFRDGTYIWGKPEQIIRESSRNKRRDFYLVHQIELPPTLTVGPYELKIIMRDKTSGEIDEAIIPFTYVADYAAARAE